VRIDSSNPWALCQVQWVIECDKIYIHWLKPLGVEVRLEEVEEGDQI
jgi:hypothetical protein